MLFIRRGFFFFLLLCIICPTEDKKSDGGKKTEIDATVYGDLDNGNRIRKKPTQKIGIEKIRHKKDYMSLRSRLRMISNEWIFKIRVIFRQEKKPSEEEIGDRGIVFYFLRDHYLVENNILTAV